MLNKCFIALTALALLVAAGAVSPSFAQGVNMSPPAPRSSESMPQPPNSEPPTMRTLPPGTTGMQRMGTVGVTRVPPKPSRTLAPGSVQPTAKPE